MHAYVPSVGASKFTTDGTNDFAVGQMSFNAGIFHLLEHLG